MTGAAAPAAAPRGPLDSVRVLLRLVQFEHTIFALPFAYVGTVLGAHGFPGGWRLLWVTVAMAGARTCAFALNRLVDREIDARNPRTAMRPSVTGEVSPAGMVLLAIVAAAALAAAGAALNTLCLELSPIPVVLFAVYPYCKRFTWLAHGVLGTATAGAPVGGYIAVTGRLDATALLLGGVVLTWMAGFDILYALMDVEHDRANGLRSVPQRFGVPAALVISDALHVVTVGALVAAGLAASLGWPFFAFAAVAAALLVYEHSIVTPRDLSRINRAFFTVNSYFAVVVLAGVLAAVAL